MTDANTASIPLDHTQRWRAFWVCVAVASFTILDMSKVNVGLPSIEATLEASSTQLQLVISGYILAFGLALVPFGRLGDQRSRKTLFVVGLALFTVSSALCAVAPTTEILLLGRFLQVDAVARHERHEQVQHRRQVPREADVAGGEEAEPALTGETKRTLSRP